MNEKLLEAIQILINKNNENFPKLYKAKIIDKTENGYIISHNQEVKDIEDSLERKIGSNVLICELPNKQSDCFIISN